MPEGNQLYFHQQYGPYEQLLQLQVKDKGNNLPVDINCITGDPPGATSHSMTVRNAELFRACLDNAIKAAKVAKL